MNQDFVDNSECYLQKRGSMRKGFGGNYRRASDGFAEITCTEASSCAGSKLGLLRGGQKSFSFCHKKGTETEQPSSSCFSATKAGIKQPSSSIPHLDCLGRTLVIYSKKKDEDLVTLCQTRPSAGTQSDSENNGRENRSLSVGNHQPLPMVTEDGTASVSVMECVKNFERTATRACAAEEKKPKTIAKTRVAELRETILRRSSENIADASCCANLPRTSKRPVSALIECSFGTFHKIPVSTIQRRSVGSLFRQPVDENIESCSQSDILRPYVRNFSSLCHNEKINGRKNFGRRLSLEHFTSLHEKDLSVNKYSLLRRTDFESNSTANDKATMPCDMRMPASDTHIGSLVKTDSSDSGIDTKVDILGNKCNQELVENFSLDSFATASSSDAINSSDLRDDVSSSSRHYQKEIDATSQMAKYVCAGDLAKSKFPLIILDLESNEFAQINSEEIRYAELASQVLSRLKEVKSEMREILLPTTAYKTSFYYMTNLIKGVGVPEFWVQAFPVKTFSERHGNRNSLDDVMQELLNCARNKLKLMKQNKAIFEKKIFDKGNLEAQISNTVKCRVEKKKYEKFCLYIGELDKVLHLMFLLTSRLASTENALADPQTEKNPLLTKTLSEKRASLLEKLEDSKSLKDGIDQRSEIVNSFLKVSLSESEYAAYQDLVLITKRLHFLRQWIEECMALYERQMKVITTFISSRLRSS